MAALRSRPARALSARQVEVLALIARGLSTDGIACELFVSPSTVRAHVRNILDALGARNRAHAVAIGCTTGLIGLDDESVPGLRPGGAGSAERPMRNGTGR